MAEHGHDHDAGRDTAQARTADGLPGAIHLQIRAFSDRQITRILSTVPQAAQPSAAELLQCGAARAESDIRRHGIKRGTAMVWPPPDFDPVLWGGAQHSATAEDGYWAHIDFAYDQLWSGGAGTPTELTVREQRQLRLMRSEERGGNAADDGAG